MTQIGPGFEPSLHAGKRDGGGGPARQPAGYEPVHHPGKRGGVLPALFARLAPTPLAGVERRFATRTRRRSRVSPPPRLSRWERRFLKAITALHPDKRGR